MIIGLKYNQTVNASSLSPEIGEFFNEENLPLWGYPIKLLELVATCQHPRDKICNLRAACDQIRRIISSFKMFVHLSFIKNIQSLLYISTKDDLYFDNNNNNNNEMNLGRRMIYFYQHSITYFCWRKCHILKVNYF